MSSGDEKLVVALALIIKNAEVHIAQGGNDDDADEKALIIEPNSTPLLSSDAAAMPSAIQRIAAEHAGLQGLYAAVGRPEDHRRRSPSGMSQRELLVISRDVYRQMPNPLDRLLSLGYSMLGCRRPAQQPRPGAICLLPRHVGRRERGIVLGLWRRPSCRDPAAHPLPSSLLAPFAAPAPCSFMHRVVIYDVPFLMRIDVAVPSTVEAFHMAYLDELHHIVLSVGASASATSPLLFISAKELCRLSFFDVASGTRPTSIDLRSLSMLERLPPASFERGSVKSLVIANCPKLAALPCRFASHSEIARLKVACMWRLGKVDNDALMACSRLETVVIHCGALQHIGTSFLKANERVTALAVSGVEQLAHGLSSYLTTPTLARIGNFFISCATMLQYIDLVELPLLRVIGADFAAYCPHLRSVRLSYLPLLDHLGERFTAKCAIAAAPSRRHGPSHPAGDQSVVIPAAHVSLLGHSIPLLRYIGDYFCSQAGALLVNLELRGLPNLQTLGRFFASASNVKFITLVDLTRLVEIQSHFASGCPRLEGVRLARLPALAIVGPGFCDDCPMLSPSRVVTDETIRVSFLFIVNPEEGTV